MIDKEVACVSESTVYRVRSEADLLSRWKRSTRSNGEYHFRPVGPNQQSHTDVMYVWVAARIYFQVRFVAAYSRYIVHDHASEFVNRDVAAEIKAHNLIDITTRARHPE